MNNDGEGEREFKGHRWFAALYDPLGKAAERGPLGKLRGRLLSDLRGDVLEIGAGTGANFEHYAPEARVIALEPDPYMLERAKPKLRPNIDLRQAPAESLPFDDASFDAVVSTLVLCTVRDLDRALSEMRRVLRPGGELRFLEHVRGDGALGSFQSFVQPVYGRLAAGCQLTRRTEQALRNAGFHIESIERRKLAPWMPAVHGTATVEP